MCCKPYGACLSMPFSSDTANFNSPSSEALSSVDQRSWTLSLCRFKIRMSYTRLSVCVPKFYFAANPIQEIQNCCELSVLPCQLGKILNQSNILLRFTMSFPLFGQKFGKADCTNLKCRKFIQILSSSLPH